MPLWAKARVPVPLIRRAPSGAYRREDPGSEETKRRIAAVLLACRWPFGRGLSMKHDPFAVRRPRRALERSARARRASHEFQPALGAAAGVADLAGCEPSGRPFFAGAFSDYLVLERRQIDADDLRRRAQPPWIGDVDDGTQVGLITHEVSAVRRKARTAGEGPCARDFADVGAIRAHHVDLGRLNRLERAGPDRMRRFTVGRERDPCPVRRPGGPEASTRFPRQVLQRLRREIQQPDFGAARACGHEGQLPSIRR